MRTKDTSPGGLEELMDKLPPQMAAVIPGVAETIDDVENRDISTIRLDAEEALMNAGVVGVLPVDISRVALAARLHKMATAQ